MKTTEPNTSSLLSKLRGLFRDREYRQAYAESFTNTLIAAQLKANRERRGLSQSELAELAGMKQSRISTIENVNYENWNIRTLRRIAQAMDLVLVVKLESFGNLVRDMETFKRDNLERPSFDDDPVFNPDKTSTRGVTRSVVLEFPGHWNTGDYVSDDPTQERAQKEAGLSGGR